VGLRVRRRIGAGTGLDGQSRSPMRLRAANDETETLIKVLTAGGPVADVGAAYGDMAYFLNSLGIPTEIIDNPPTNFNSLEGDALLGRLLHSEVPIHSVDLDSQFTLPHANYSLILFLGILYHLENPYYALKAM